MSLAQALLAGVNTFLNVKVIQLRRKSGIAHALPPTSHPCHQTISSVPSGKDAARKRVAIGLTLTINKNPCQML